MTGNLLFSTDNTLDIGATGATRPRDLFLGRNAVIGGTLGVTGATTLAALSATTGTFSSTLGVTGAATLSSTLAVTGATTLSAALGGTAATFSGTVTGNLFSGSGASLTSIPETAITDGSLLARVGGTETITGTWTFTSGVTNFSNAAPFVNLIETDQSSNNQFWRNGLAGSTWFVSALDDAGSSGNFAIQVTRSGTTPQLMTISTALALPNSITPSALASGSTNDYNPTGLSTAYFLRLTANAAGSTLTGLVAQAAGSVRVLCNLAAVGGITFAGEDAGSTAANRFAVASAVGAGGCVNLIYDGTATRWRAF